MSGLLVRLERTVRLLSLSVLKHNCLKNTELFDTPIKRYGSSLYVPGKNARETFAVLSPYLDFDDRFANMEKLKKDLAMRGTKVDPVDLKKTWEFYRYVDTNKWALEHRRIEIANRMKEFQRRKDLSPEEEQKVIKLKTEGKVVRQDLKIVREILWELEESVVVRALKLPNEVHKKTPAEVPLVLSRHGSKLEPATEKLLSHIEIGRALGIVEYRSPSQCYLCNEAAQFELGVLGLAGNIFGNDNMMRVAGSDFSRSIIVEGAGINHEDPTEAFILQDSEDIKANPSNRLHLVGGASLVSFLAMHTKQLINPNHFPLRYFATGRQYTPPSESNPIGLFTICQASAAHAFVAVKDMNSSEHKQQFDKLLQAVSALYDSVCSHYQIVLRPASELKPWESLRISFELWSAFSKQYVEVGHISACGEYFSKRLLIGYQTPSGRKFPAIISGTVLSVPRLLGCLLEEHPEKFIIPPKVQEFMPVDYTPPKYVSKTRKE